MKLGLVIVHISFCRAFASWPTTKTVRSEELAINAGQISCGRRDKNGQKIMIGNSSWWPRVISLILGNCGG